MKSVRTLILALAVVGALAIVGGALLAFKMVHRGVARAGSAPDDVQQEHALRRTGLVLVARVADGPADLRRQLSAARREGIPTTPAELQAPLPPPSQNAAPVWQTLMTVERSARHSFTGMDDITLTERVRKAGGYNRQDLPIYLDYLRGHPRERKLVHQAVSRPTCVFRRDWSQGPNLLLPEYAYMRAGVRLLTYESAALALEGQYEQALRNQALGLRLAQQAGSDPSVIAYLVEAACEQITLRGMEAILQTAGPNVHLDNLARQLVIRGRPHYSLRRAIAGAIILALTSAQMMDRAGRTRGWSAALVVLARLSDSQAPSGSGSQPVDLPSDPGGKKFAHEWVSEGAAEMLQEYRRFYHAAALAPPARLRFFDGEGKKLDQKMEAATGLTAVTDPGLLLGAIFYPLLDRLPEREMLARENEEALEGGAAALAYRASRGAFPDRLSQAISPAPVNPFTLKPLQYHRTAAGFEVYDPSKATGGINRQYGSFTYP